MPDSITVVRQFLVLFVVVRIHVGQQKGGLFAKQPPFIMTIPTSLFFEQERECRFEPHHCLQQQLSLHSFYI